MASDPKPSRTPGSAETAWLVIEADDLLIVLEGVYGGPLDIEVLVAITPTTIGRSAGPGGIQGARPLAWYYVNYLPDGPLKDMASAQKRMRS
jgi:hypothetical protein